MKPITEQRRQELIERLKKIAAWEKTYGAQHNVMLPASEARELAEITLISLNAKPIAVTDISEIDDLKNEGWVGNFLAPEFQGVDSEDRVYLYTAPPVPVIKLPDWSQVSPDGFLDINADLARYHYGEEIKRLNGLGE